VHMWHDDKTDEVTMTGDGYGHVEVVNDHDYAVQFTAIPTL
jgi:hypothetical protein